VSSVHDTRGTTLIVPARCNGPDASGNGGWTAGALAEHAPGSGPVVVRLMAPPPLETPLSIETDGDTVRLVHEDRTIATATPGGATSAPPEDGSPVTLEQAAGAAESYLGFGSHPFPRCFACGPERAEGDGLRIFPGRLPDGRVAAVWRAYDVDVPTTWAALDCVGGWSSDIDQRPMVLGQMTAEALRMPQGGATYAVVGAELGVDGRKTHTRSQMFDGDGSLVAHAEHVWIEVDPAAFNALD
jgi:hypothetical protein